MTLHQSLADLARDHGHALFSDAAAFRGSLDDYLDEGQASSGTINLLTDAVRLGALDGLLTMLDSGARPADAVDSAGQRLARERGSADVRGCQWAVAVLGFALGKVPESLVTGLDPEAGTAAPPSYGPGGTAPTQPPVTSPIHQPMVSPPHQPMVSPPHQPVVSPPHQPVQGGGYPPSYGAPAPVAGGWTPQGGGKKSNAGFLVAAVAVALVVLVAGIIGIIAVANGGGDNKADDPKSPTSETTKVTEPPDLGGPEVEGTGFTAQLPKGWTDGTDDFVADNPGLNTLDRVYIWGTTFNTARGNIIVETQSSYGNDDPEGLEDDWKSALTSGDTTATSDDIEPTTIGGEKALGVNLDRTNDNGVKVAQRSYLVISGDTGYSITVSLKSGDDEVLDKFEDILSTWRWTE